MAEQGKGCALLTSGAQHRPGTSRGTCPGSPAGGIMLCAPPSPRHIFKISYYPPSLLLLQPWHLKKDFHFTVKPNKTELGRGVCCSPRPPPPNNTRKAKAEKVARV